MAPESNVFQQKNSTIFTVNSQHDGHILLV